MTRFCFVNLCSIALTTQHRSTSHSGLFPSTAQWCRRRNRSPVINWL